MIENIFKNHLFKASKYKENAPELMDGEIN